MMCMVLVCMIRACYSYLHWDALSSTKVLHHTISRHITACASPHDVGPVGHITVEECPRRFLKDELAYIHTHQHAQMGCGAHVAAVPNLMVMG